MLVDKPDWCGALWGSCFECSSYSYEKVFPDGEVQPPAKPGESKIDKKFTKERVAEGHYVKITEADKVEKAKKAFKRAVGRSWLKHAEERKARVTTERNLRFNNIVDHFRQKYPGSTKSDVRELASARCKFASLAFAASLALESEALQKKAAEAYTDYVRVIEQGAANPRLADLQMGRTLRCDALSYLNKMTEHMVLSYLCRFPECGFFGMNSQWIKQIDREQFRCPICGGLYQPCSVAKGQVSAAKVISITSPITAEVMHIPCVWPQGAEDSYLSKLIEAKAEEVISIADFGEATSAGNCEAIDTYARQVGIPGIFSILPMQEKAKWKLDEGKFPPSQWRHLELKGVYGAMLDLKSPFKTFDDFNELVVLMGHALAVGRKLAQ